MSNDTFDEVANLYYPQGCQCHDDSGSCDWCRVYYGEDKPWIDEEGRTIPLPHGVATCKDQHCLHPDCAVTRSYPTPPSTLELAEGILSDFGNGKGAE